MGACTTYLAQVQRALATKNGDTLWVAIGRTSPWTPDDEIPDDPQPGATGIDEPICYRRPVKLTVAKQVDQATYDGLPETDRSNVNGILLQFVDDEDAYTEYARLLYFRAVWNPVTDGHPADDFRQVGLFSGLVPSAGHEADDWLAPANVDDPGLLEYVDNGTVQLMDGTGPIVTTHGVIEFR